MSKIMARLPFRRQDSTSVVAPAVSQTSKEQAYEDNEKSAQGYCGDDKVDHDGAEQHVAAPGPDAAVADLDPRNLLANGKERPIETAEDISTRCISLEDDPTLIVHTIRMWVIGLGLTCFAAVLGQIFYFRPQTVFVSQLFLQVIAFIMGKAWAKALPNADKGRFWAILNPCDFNIKEHVAILVMSSTATGSALAISVFAAEELYYDVTPGYAVAIFTLLGSQLFGYGIAGLMRSFTVFPTYIVFPNLIPTVALFDALHRDPHGPSQKKRLKFFWMVFAIIFCWEWIPEFVAPTLTGISIFWLVFPERLVHACAPNADTISTLSGCVSRSLARRNSPWFTRIFGGSNGNEGLGLFSMCTDWNYLGSGGGSLGALFTPFSTQISLYCGVALCIILFCACWLFYLNGTEYDQLAILNPDFSLNEAKLAEQGLPWYSTSNAIYYIGSNLAIGATLTHVILWFMPSIVKAFKEYRDRSQPDPHYKKMLMYREVPMWWYCVTLVVSFAMAMATCYTGHSQLPWWALIMLGAAIVPGNSRANLYFTLYGANSTSQALGLTRDLKMGQYTKLPPISTFVCQVVGTIVGAILQLIIMKSIISAQREILLSVQGTNIWSGQQVQSYYNSQAVAWGALARPMYGPDRSYFIIPLSIVIGLFVPVPFWLGHKLFPKLKLNQVVTPIMCWCLGYLSVGINSSIFGTMCIALFSQYYLRRRRATWFRKYNYLLSAALEGGTQFMVFIATFALFGGSGEPVVMPTWALNPDSTTHNFGEFDGPLRRYRHMSSSEIDQSSASFTDYCMKLT
ncbi:BZ3500_MvSof-1268-A1-R1_Chr3-1g06126 [Microbotryum saponariae]|uniref:BZ3500_MvSof-1268-A1-R1_Chr3-1g06126 protein n=1 Tax=Microbotryum saponariae TaxID=289078 RepID=A0A2X0N4H3_9BASI|nr:BZ3500_MvSof-1268-A1-R1_Chr3-1g06126 [Microbotryum saponariae]